MVAYVHIEYSTHQFSEESKGGWNPPPPRSLRYRKKRGPERVNTARKVIFRWILNLEVQTESEFGSDQIFKIRSGTAKKLTDPDPQPREKKKPRNTMAQ